MVLAWVIQFLADIVGRKPMLILVLFGMGLSSMVMGLSRTIGQVGIGFFLLWVCFSSDIWIIIVSEEAPEDRRARYASLITVVGALGALAIPASRGLLIHHTHVEDPTLWRTMTYLAILAPPLSILGLGWRTLSFALSIVSGSLAAGAFASIASLGTVYLVFAGLGVMIIPFLVLKYLPETRGLEIIGTAH